MQAVRVTLAGGPLELVERDVPEPTGSEVTSHDDVRRAAPMAIQLFPHESQSY
jgi:hypothetical protein